MAELKIFEANMTRYKLVIGRYEEAHNEMCFFTWLDVGTGGKTFTWEKGSSLYGSYVTDKSSIGIGDLSGILSYIQIQYPEFIENLYQFNKNYYYDQRS